VGARNGGRIGQAQVGAGAVTIQLQPAATIHGTLATGGNAATSFTVSVQVNDGTQPWEFGGPGGSLEFAGDHFDLYDQPGVPVTVSVKTADGRSGSAQVALTPGQEASVSIALTDSASLLGRVLQVDGKTPVAGAVLLLDGSVRGRGGSLTGADGRFRMDGLAAGEHTLGVRAGSFSAPPRDVSLNPGQPTDLGDIVLAMPVTPSGTIGARFFSSGAQIALGGVVPGGPADRAGILEGDLLVALDGTPPKSLADAQARAVGAPLSTVSVTWQHAGGAPQTQAVQRAP
jgi:hypothetical protein